MSCVHTRVPAESNGHVATKCRDNCRAFPSSRRLAAVGGWFLFRRHSTKRDSYPALGNHLPSRARVPSIASTRNTPSRFNVLLDVSSQECLAPSARYPPPCSPPLAHDARAVTRTSVRAFSPLCAPRSLLSILSRHVASTRCEIFRNFAI